MCSRFDPIPACDRQTDRQTGGIAVARTALVMPALRRAVKIENRLAFGKVRGKSRLAPFFRTRCRPSTDGIASVIGRECWASVNAMPGTVRSFKPVHKVDLNFVHS